MVDQVQDPAGTDNTQDPPDTNEQDNWLESLPEEMRENEHLKGLDGVGALAKEYVQGKESKPVVPENPDGYEIKVPEDAAPDEFAQGLLKTKAHELNFTQTQVDGVMDVYKGMVEKAQENHKSELEAGKQECITELQTDWKEKFDENVVMAKKAAASVFDEDFRKFIDESGLGNHPGFVKGLLVIGQSISEDVLKRGTDIITTQGEPLRAQDGSLMLDFSESMPDK